jgi:DNA-directed RNA polymerase subunit RPC12/RpoP
MANTANQSRTCPYCGSKITIYGARVLAKSETTQEAVEIIQHLKQKKNKDPHPVTFKKFKA